jgi:hypothetical protein
VPNEDELRATFASKARQVLPPITDGLYQALVDHEGDASAQRKAVGDAMAKAFMQGTMVGWVECQAQAAEQGIDLHTTWLGNPDAD